MGRVSTMSSVSTTFELLQQKHPNFNSWIDKKDQTVKEPRARSSSHLFENLSAKVFRTFLNSIIEL